MRAACTSPASGFRALCHLIARNDPKLAASIVAEQRQRVVGHTAAGMLIAELANGVEWRYAFANGVAGETR